MDPHIVVYSDRTMNTLSKILTKIRSKTIMTGRSVKGFFTPIHFPSSVRAQSPAATLDKMIDFLDKEQAGAYLRFGDGEIR